MKFVRVFSILTIMLFSCNSIAAGAGIYLRGVKGTLKNVEKAIKSAVSKAEELYEQNGGGALSGDIALVDSAQNPFINTLTIRDDYSINFMFGGSPGTTFEDTSATGSATTVPVTQALQSAKILLIPIYNPGDAVITSWECITDAEIGLKTFMGEDNDKEALRGTISYISTNGNNGTNEYLSNCIYDHISAF
jgi:hypothetical protein